MPKVLIVDDEEDILWGLSEELTRNGIDVDTASNGQEAFEKIKDNDYDFLVTDIRMPGMSGSELLLKSKNLRPDLKVIVMTAYGSDELKEEVLSHGAISYLEKPFDFEQLLEVIKEKEKKVDETISKLSLNQFLQLVAMEGQSCTITVKTDEGEGKIYFIDGEVVNIEFRNLTGEEAFVKIMKFQNPAFNVEWEVPKTKRTIEKPLHALLLSAVAKKEEEDMGEAESEQIEEEVDLSALSNLFAEDEGVKEEVKEDVVEEEEVQKEGSMGEEEEVSLEGFSFEDEGVVEEEEVVEPEVEEVEEPVEEKVAEEKKEESTEEEFSLENLESMLEEEVKEEEEEGEITLENLESVLEEAVGEEVEEENVVEESKESEEILKEEEEAIEEAELPQVEVSEENLEVEEGKEEVEEVKAEEGGKEEVKEEEVISKVEEGEKKEEEEIEEVKTEEKREEVEKEEVVSEVIKEEEVEETPSPAYVEETPSKEVIVPEDKISVVEDILRKVVAFTTDIRGGIVCDINGNVVAEQFRTGSLKGEGVGHLGRYAGGMFRVLKEVTGEVVEEMTLSLKNENLIGAPALDGKLFIFVSAVKRTMKLALIKVQLKKAVADLTKELS